MMKTFETLREELLLEILKASDPTSKWIHDFVYSDNPKFKGKSKKERIRMALGAKYAAMRKEETNYFGEHVYSDIFGNGIVLENEYAEPDSEGKIDWYTVKFDHGNEIIFADDLDILVNEQKNNKKPLHPNQKKLDVASPKGKLTAADFAALRASKRNK